VVLSLCLQSHELGNLKGIIVTAPLVRFAKEAHFNPKSKRQRQALSKGFVPDNSKDPQIAASFKADTLCHAYLSSSTAAAISEAGKKLLSQAKSLSRPILIVHGDADKVSSLLAAVDLHESVGSKDRTMKIWPGLCHDVENEPEKEQVYKFIIDWMQQRM